MGDGEYAASAFSLSVTQLRGSRSGEVGQAWATVPNSLDEGKLWTWTEAGLIYPLCIIT